METAILIELERRGMAVTYIRTPADYEVDFLARSATGEIELIQVAADPTGTGQELRALAEAGRVYPKAGRRLLALTFDAVPTDVPAGILVQPAYEWILTAPGATGKGPGIQNGCIMDPRGGDPWRP